MTNLISTVIALPYEIARLPLAIVDDNLLNRLPETSGPRVRLDRTIGSVDKLAGTLLRNRDIAERGVDRIERSEKLLTADRLEQEAATRREKASETAAAGRRKAAQKRRVAQDRASGLDEAEAAEARGKQQATAKAAKTAAAKKAAATRRAESRTAAAKREESLANLVVGNELAYGLGAEVSFSLGKHRLAADAMLAGARGLKTTTGSEARPLELMAAVKYHLTDAFAIHLGAGPGLSRGYGTPVYRGFLGVNWTAGARDGRHSPATP